MIPYKIANSINVSLAAVVLGLTLGSLPASADFLGFGVQVSGGSGTWGNGASPDPANPYAQWFDFTTGTNGNWNNANSDEASFFGPGGVVNVATDITASDMNFYQSGDETLTGTGTLTVNRGGYQGIINDQSNSNVTINNPVDFDTVNVSDRTGIYNQGTGTLTLSAPLTFVSSGATSVPSRGVLISGANGSTTVLNGMSVGTSGVAGNISFGGINGNPTNGVLVLKGDYSTIGSGFVLGPVSGVIKLETSNLGSGYIVSYVGGSPTVETIGSQNISNVIYALNNQASVTSVGIVVGQGDAAQSTFSGQIASGSADFGLMAVDGARANFTGDFTGSNVGGLIKTGGGTVTLSGNNNYDIYNWETGTSGTVAADLKAGTTLINNTAASSSAFGNNSGSVLVEAGATLGGNGSTGGSQQVVAVAANSVLAPGDAGQAAFGINPSIGILRFAGGLAATNGLIMNFKLDGDASAPGVNNDLLSIGGVALGGTVTINISNLGAAVDTATPYTLMYGSGNWTQAEDTTFVINTPAGYVLDQDWEGNGTDPNTGLPERGYDFDTGNQYFQVKFIAVPEPSTYALVGLGLLCFMATLLRGKPLR